MTCPTLSFSSPRVRATALKGEIFDVRNRLVRRPGNGERRAGRHEVTCNARDKPGPSGRGGTVFPETEYLRRLGRPGGARLTKAPPEVYSWLLIPVILCLSGCDGTESGNQLDPPRLIEVLDGIRILDIAGDTTGTFYGISTEPSIKSFAFDGTLLATFGNTGPAEERVIEPWAIALDGAGNIHTCDRDRRQVLKFAPGGAFLLAWGGPGSGPGLFERPAGIALAPDGALLVADSENRNIQEFTADGVFVKSWVVSGGNPGDLAVGEGNHVYVVLEDKPRLLEYSRDGVLLNTWETDRVSAHVAAGKSDQVWVASFDIIDLYSTGGARIGSWTLSSEASTSNLTATGIGIVAGWVYVGGIGSPAVRFPVEPNVSLARGALGAGRPDGSD